MTKDSNNKADSSSSKQKNGASSDTPAALFPRLHVKETRNNGPRAPPRNKMALYEQFTIPSHRFQQQSTLQQQQQQQQSRIPSPQPFMAPAAFAGGYYLPYYVPAPVAFQPMNVMPVNHNVSSNFEGGECDQGDVQRVPGGSVADNSGHLLRVSSLQSKCGSKGKSKKKEHEQEDFAVPTYLTKKMAPQQETVTTTVGNSTICTADEVHRRVENSHTTEGSKALPAAGNNDESRVQTFSPSSCESGGIDNQSDEDPARRSDPQEEAERSDDSESSMLENLAVPQVSSKEIMTVMGDEQFWKMRKAMQRQQSIFQKQLFELHRLTKVQQLMAAAGLCNREEKRQLQEQRKSGIENSSTEQAKEDNKKNNNNNSNNSNNNNNSNNSNNNNNSNNSNNNNNTKKASAELKVSKQSNPVRVEESPSRPETNAASTEVPSYDYRFCPPPSNMAYPTYPSFPPGTNYHQHQWYAPVPVQFQYQQPFPAPPVYNTPYGPVFGGPPPPMPFVPYNCEQRLQDPRYNLAPPSQAQQWQQPPSYFTDPSMQWMGYVKSGQENSSQTPAASSAHSRKDFQSQAGSSSAGFSLIQRSKQMEANESHQRSNQQKLVGKFTETKQASNSAGKSSPYSRPSGFHAVNTSNTTQTTQIGERTSGRIIKVTPKAALVTAESAAEILQSIRQERN